jgi:hypothetical protein
MKKDGPSFDDAVSAARTGDAGAIRGGSCARRGALPMSRCRRRRPGGGHLSRLALLDGEDRPRQLFATGEAVKVCVGLHLPEPPPRGLSLSVDILRQGHRLHFLELDCLDAGDRLVTLEIESLNLLRGSPGDPRRVREHAHGPEQLRGMRERLVDGYAASCCRSRLSTRAACFLSAWIRSGIPFLPFTRWKRFSASWPVATQLVFSWSRTRCGCALLALPRDSRGCACRENRCAAPSSSPRPKQSLAA